jgi:hypothetical protein
LHQQYYRSKWKEKGKELDLAKKRARKREREVSNYKYHE